MGRTHAEGGKIFYETIQPQAEHRVWTGSVLESFLASLCDTVRRLMDDVRESGKKNWKSEKWEIQK